jgi:Big-like domain-containing protein
MKGSTQMLSLLAGAMLIACAGDVAAPTQAVSSVRGPSTDRGDNGLTLVVKPVDPTIDIGKTVQLTYTIVNPAGHEVPSNRPISWASSDESIATVSEDGLVTGIDDGKATITGTGGGVSGSTVVEIGCVEQAAEELPDGTKVEAKKCKKKEPKKLAEEIQPA